MNDLYVFTLYLVFLYFAHIFYTLFMLLLPLPLSYLADKQVNVDGGGMRSTERPSGCCFMLYQIFNKLFSTDIQSSVQ